MNIQAEFEKQAVANITGVAFGANGKTEGQVRKTQVLNMLELRVGDRLEGPQ
jgi:hypothetical protein